jgi:hypothetical protein
MRDVEKVLQFRNDISPFLVHLTRDIGANSAKSNLKSILKSKTLKYGDTPISDARFRYPLEKLTTKKKRLFFSAVSFTETPLGEIHNLLEIRKRSVDLKPYGLVFLKERLRSKGVSPVFYINNMKGDQNDAVEALCSLIDTHPRVALKVTPFIALFGKLLSPMGGTAQNRKRIDFTWEREWRYASRKPRFKFTRRDLFIGLCPDEDIDEFETEFKTQYKPLRFIDPRRTLKWYAEQLLDAKDQSKLGHSAI